MAKVKIEQIDITDLAGFMESNPAVDRHYIDPTDVQHPGTLTKVTRMGHVTQLLTMVHKSDGCRSIVKLSKDLYWDWKDQEVKEYRHIDDRSGSLESIRQTLERIRGLVNSNIFSPTRVRWATLTYKENMTDTKRLYEDYHSFWKRFKRWNKSNGYSKPEYITVVEPQGRGAWHIHAFFIWSDVAPFIPNNEVLWPMWGHGFTSIKSFSQYNTNPGAYFSAYLADMPLEQFDSLSDEDKAKALTTGCTIQDKMVLNDDGEEKSKKFVKGARLHFYPPGMNIVRSSRGVQRPVSEYMTLSEAKEKVSAATETFNRSYHLYTESDNSERRKSINIITKSYYNDII